MPEKKAGHGAVLKQGATTISQIVDFDPPILERDEVPSATLDSTVDETLPGDPEKVGELTFKQAWTPGDANHELLDTAFNAKSVDAYSIVWAMLSTSYTDSFSGWVKRLGPEKVESKKLITRMVTIKLTTTVTRAATV